MQNLNHFVTYIYSYRQNQKDKNVGFAKVDCRGEYIRLELQVRKEIPRKEDAQICFLAKEGERVIAIPMAEIHFERDTGNYKGRFLTKKMGHSNYSFKDITGLYIRTGQEVFASQWLEEELDMNRIEALKKEPTPQILEKEIKEDKEEHTLEAAEIKNVIPKEEKKPFDWCYEWEKLEQHSGSELVFGLALWTRNKGKS